MFSCAPPWLPLSGELAARKGRLRGRLFLSASPPAGLSEGHISFPVERNMEKKDAQGLRPLRNPGAKIIASLCPSAHFVGSHAPGLTSPSAERSGERGRLRCARSAKAVLPALRPIFSPHRGVSQEGRFWSPSWVIFLPPFFLSAKRMGPAEHVSPCEAASPRTCT